MPEYWILWALGLLATLIGLASNAAWRRKYDALLAESKRMNQTWFVTASRHNRVWSSKCRALEIENDRLREQLRTERGEEALP